MKNILDYFTIEGAVGGSQGVVQKIVVMYIGGMRGGYCL